MNEVNKQLTGEFFDPDVMPQPYFVVTCAACESLLRVDAGAVDQMTPDERDKAFLCAECEISFVEFPEPSELRIIGKTILLIVLCMLGAGVGIFILLAFAASLPG